MKNHNTIGIDIGDKFHVVCALDPDGNELFVKTIRNTKKALIKVLSIFNNAVVAIEACVHSHWISRLLENLGHNVYVANPRKLRCIWDAVDKTDLRDARMLAKIARFDAELLCPIKHRSEDAQTDLQFVKARELLCNARTKLVNSIRTSVKLMGERIPAGWSTKCFAEKTLASLREDLLATFKPVLEIIQHMSIKIDAYQKSIEQLCETKYPQTALLRQVNGVGAITSLTYILTLEDAKRYKKSRDVGAYLGLVPKRDQSGSTDKQLHITKAGNSYLRKLLVSCANYILGPFGTDCELKRHGEKLSLRGGKNAKKRAVIAITRKLAVLLHRLWISESEYSPFFNTLLQQKKAS